MDSIREKGYEILDIVKTIYQLEEERNPSAIIGNKIFSILADGRVLVECNNDKTDHCYYFETPEMDGVMIKKENGNYCIKASVEYVNTNHQYLWFAKIRIEEFNNEEIKMMGNWGGSWQQSDFDDKDLYRNPNSDFPVALDSMKNHLSDMYYSLCQNNRWNSALYDSNMVKKIKKYNN